MAITREVADAIAESTHNAYSYPSYVHGAWREACRRLARRGYDAEQIEEIMRSKITRWSGDNSQTNNYGRYTSTDILRFVDRYGITPENIGRFFDGKPIK